MTLSDPAESTRNTYNGEINIIIDRGGCFNLNLDEIDVLDKDKILIDSNDYPYFRLALVNEHVLQVRLKETPLGIGEYIEVGNVNEM